MALSSLIQSLSDLPLTTLLPASVLVGLLTLCIYRLYFHPLAHIPGPLLCRLTSLWTYYHSYIGDECRYITQYHALYGPVLRIAPNEICIADGAALAPIYSDKGGFAKAACYRNFDIDGFASLFSQTVKELRAPRAKSVVPLFSTAHLRQGEKVLMECVDRLVRRLRAEKASRTREGKAVNVLNLSRSLALDAVTAYLLGTSYGGLEEAGTAHMSASEFVDAFVSVGRFFYLPNWIFVLCELAAERLYGTKETEASMGKVDAFLWKVVNATSAADASYPGRMLNAGFAPDEVVAQCKDLMFAGTDSSGMNLSTLFWQLARNPPIYEKLREEVLAAKAAHPEGYDPSTLPYLRNCIREALRLSMANPTRLPRAVPEGGWVFSCRADEKTYHFPAGTLVSAQIQTLHHNEKVYEDPMRFWPERWEDERASPEMHRDFIPFGLGQRQCIARNLAMTELTLVGNAVVADGVLEGAQAEGESIEIVEWFNSKVVGEKVELRWAKA